jgi:two-component system, cell cycle response regulator
MKVLTVDDSRTIRLLVRRYLEPLGLQILEAADGKIGVEVAQAERPDLIVLDVTMPVMDGHQTLEKIRAIEDLQKTPVLMLTAESRKDLVVSLIQLGIADYIVKPFDRDLLVAKVSKVLGLEEMKQAETPEPGEADDDKPDLPRVLVLDDKENVLLAAQKFLSEKAVVIATKEAYEAVELAGKYRPQVLLLDLVIPDVNVFEIFSMMKADEGIANSRFIAMAIRTMRDEVTRARRAGFHDLLLKPFDQKSIARVLRRNLVGRMNLLAYEKDHAVFRYPALSEQDTVTPGAFAQQALRQAEQALSEVADSGYERLLLDMSEADQSDMSVVSGISAILKSAETLAIHVRIMVPQGPLARMLRTFSETCNTPIYATAEEAIAAFPAVEEEFV